MRAECESNFHRLHDSETVIFHSAGRIYLFAFYRRRGTVRFRGVGKKTKKTKNSPARPSRRVPSAFSRNDRRTRGGPRGNATTVRGFALKANRSGPAIRDDAVFFPSSRRRRRCGKSRRHKVCLGFDRAEDPRTRAPFRTILLSSCRPD